METEKKQTISYFARTICGVEEIAAGDIQEKVAVDRITYSHRIVEFESSSDPNLLLKIKGVDDIFINLGKLKGIGHKREALTEIARQVGRSNLNEAIKICAKVRPVPKSIKFSITASFLGKRNYNRWEIAEYTKNILCAKYSWTYVNPKTGSLAPHDISIRIHLSDRGGIVGVRLGAQPLFKRNYKIESIPGSLTPPLAYLMCRLSCVKEGNAIVDPLCGVGTIPIEAGYLQKRLLIIGGDIDAEICLASRRNVNHAQSCAKILQMNSLNLPLPDKSVQAIVSDLPWGHQTLLKLVPNTEQPYCLLFEEFSRILTPFGRMVIMAEDTNILEESVNRASLEVKEKYLLSLFGRHPTIFVIEN